MKLLIRRKPSWIFRHTSRLNMVDMHVHTDYSDGNFSIKSLVRRCLRKHIGVCVADHNYVRGSLEMCKTNVFTIPSVELTTNDYIDILAYFYHPSDLKDFYEKHIRGCRIVPAGLNFNLLKWRTSELLNKLKDYNCVIGMAHPDAAEPQNAIRFFRDNSHLLKEIDTIEVMNSLQSYQANRRAYDLALALGKPMTGGSDAHVLRGVGMTVTVSDGYDVDRFLGNVLKGKSFVRGRPLLGTRWFESAYHITKDILFWKRKALD